MKNKFTLLIPVLLLCGFLIGCEKTGRPVRKKIPDLTSLDGIFNFKEQPGGDDDLPFHITDMTLVEDGGLADYLYVSLPYAKDDSMVLNLVNSYKPFALTLLSQWENLQKKGVLIDLRSSSHSSRKTEYLLEKPQSFSIPVTFVWDPVSAARVNTFISVLRSMPVIHVSSISEYPPTGGGRDDCFSPGSPWIN